MRVGYTAIHARGEAMHSKKSDFSSHEQPTFIAGDAQSESEALSDRSSGGVRARCRPTQGAGGFVARVHCVRQGARRASAEERRVCERQPDFVHARACSGDDSYRRGALEAVPGPNPTFGARRSSRLAHLRGGSQRAPIRGISLVPISLLLGG